MKEIRLDQAIGKTLINFEFSLTIGQVVLVFDDNTFSTISAKIQFGQVEIDQGFLNISDFGNEKLAALGIFNQE